MHQALQQAGIDVPPTQNRDRWAHRSNSPAEKCGRGNRAGRLHRKTRLLVQETNPGDDVGFGYLHRFAYHTREDSEGQLPNGERKQSVSQAVGVIERHGPTGLERTSKFGGPLRLDSDYPDLRL